MLPFSLFQVLSAADCHALRWAHGANNKGRAQSVLDSIFRWDLSFAREKGHTTCLTITHHICITCREDLDYYCCWVAHNRCDLVWIFRVLCPDIPCYMLRRVLRTYLFIIVWNIYLSQQIQTCISRHGDIQFCKGSSSSLNFTTLPPFCLIYS